VPKDEAKTVPLSGIKAETIDPETVRLEKQARGAGVFFTLKGQLSHDTEGRPATPAALDPLPRNPFAFPPWFPDQDPARLAAGFEPQAAKDRFVKATPDAATLNPHRLSKPVSPYQVLAGTAIAASLITGLNSDLPGFVIAQVTEAVYDTVSGRHLLIPQGSRLLGKYDARVSFGQDRALIVWQRLIRPDGSSLVIDNHEWRLVKGVALATLLNVGTALSANDSDLLTAFRQASGQTVSRAGQSIVERQLNVQPTITIRPGWPLRVIVQKDLVLEPYRVR
jgi:type IV secretion system protein VirB10